MEVTVLGCGYVGLLSGIYLASEQHHVIFSDRDAHRLGLLEQGCCPLQEPGLEELMQRSKPYWRCATQSQVWTKSTSCYLIAVGTPTLEDGRSDLSDLWQVVQRIAQVAEQQAVVVIKSTIPVGTTAKIAAYLQRHSRPQAIGAVIYHPEFLREGHGVQDCWSPSRLIIGCEQPLGLAVMAQWYHRLLRRQVPMLQMNWASAELSKYAANGLLAVRLAFLNQLLPLARSHGAVMDDVIQSIALDERIGPHYARIGLGFGGPCLPKDVAALTTSMAQIDQPHGLLSQINPANQWLREDFLHRLTGFFPQGLKGKRFAVWGMAFKPGIDDVRASPGMAIIQALLEQGCSLHGYDPMAMTAAQQYLDHHERFAWAASAQACLPQTHGLLILTAWPQFHRELVAFPSEHGMVYPLIMDGWDLLKTEQYTHLPAVHYVPMGRPASLCPLWPDVYQEPWNHKDVSGQPQDLKQQQHVPQRQRALLTP